MKNYKLFNKKASQQINKNKLGQQKKYRHLGNTGKKKSSVIV